MKSKATAAPSRSKKGKAKPASKAVVSAVAAAGPPPHISAQHLLNLLGPAAANIMGSNNLQNAAKDNNMNRGIAPVPRNLQPSTLDDTVVAPSGIKSVHKDGGKDNHNHRDKDKDKDRRPARDEKKEPHMQDKRERHDRNNRNLDRHDVDYPSSLDNNSHNNHEEKYAASAHDNRPSRDVPHYHAHAPAPLMADMPPFAHHHHHQQQQQQANMFYPPQSQHYEQNNAQQPPITQQQQQQQQQQPAQLSPVAKNRAKAMGSTIFNLEPSLPSDTITGRHRGRVVKDRDVALSKHDERERERERNDAQRHDYQQPTPAMITPPAPSSISPSNMLHNAPSFSYAPPPPASSSYPGGYAPPPPTNAAYPPYPSPYYQPQQSPPVSYYAQPPTAQPAYPLPPSDQLYNGASYYAPPSSHYSNASPSFGAQQSPSYGAVSTPSYSSQPPPSFSAAAASPSSDVSVRASWGGGGPSLEDGAEKRDAERAKRMELRAALDAQVKERAAQLPPQHNHRRKHEPAPPLSDHLSPPSQPPPQPFMHYPSQSQSQPQLHHPSYQPQQHAQQQQQQQQQQAPSQQHQQQQYTPVYGGRGSDITNPGNDRAHRIEKENEQSLLRAALAEQVEEKRRRKAQELADIRAEEDKYEQRFNKQIQSSASQPSIRVNSPPNNSHGAGYPPYGAPQGYGAPHAQPNHQQPYPTHISPPAPLHLDDHSPANVQSPSKVAENRSKAMASSVFGDGPSEQASRDAAKSAAQSELQKQILERKHEKEERARLEADAERRDNDRVERERLELLRRYQGVSPRTAAAEAAKMQRQQEEEAERTRRREQGMYPPQDYNHAAPHSPPHSHSHAHQHAHPHHASPPRHHEPILEEEDGREFMRRNSEVPFEVNENDHKNIAKLLEITEAANQKVKKRNEVAREMEDSGESSAPPPRAAGPRRAAAARKPRAASNKKKEDKGDWRQGWGAGQKNNKAKDEQPQRKPPIPRQGKQVGGFKPVYDDVPPAAPKRVVSNRRASNPVPTSPTPDGQRMPRSKSAKAIPPRRRDVAAVGAHAGRRHADAERHMDVEIERADYDDRTVVTPTRIPAPRVQSGRRRKPLGNDSRSHSPQPQGRRGHLGPPSPQSQSHSHSHYHSNYGSDPNSRSPSHSSHAAPHYQWAANYAHHPLDASLRGNSEFILSTWPSDDADGLPATELERLMVNYGSTIKPMEPLHEPHRERERERERERPRDRDRDVRAHDSEREYSSSHSKSIPASPSKSSLQRERELRREDDANPLTNRTPRTTRHYHASTIHLQSSYSTSALELPSSSHSQRDALSPVIPEGADSSQDLDHYSQDEFAALSPQEKALPRHGARPRVFDPFQMNNQ